MAAKNPATPSAQLPRSTWLTLVMVLTMSFLMPSAVLAAQPEVSGYATLLKRYLRPVGNKGEPFDTRFDYEQLYIDEQINTKRRSDRLDTIRGQMLAVSPGSLSPAERLAWALNTYNFLVIEKITLNLLVPGKKFLRYDSTRDMQLPTGAFYAAHVVRLDGANYSLAGFARRFVYGDTLDVQGVDLFEARREASDPRLMFALAHGTIGASPLLPWVYSADSLEAQLDRATRIALALPAWLRIDPVAGTLLASNHLFEERLDLGGPEMPGLIPLIHRFGTRELRNRVAKRKLIRPDMYFEPTWKLNQYEHPKPQLPGLAGGDSTRIQRRP